MICALGIVFGSSTPTAVQAEAEDKQNANFNLFNNLSRES